MNFPADVDLTGLEPGQIIHVCHKVVDGVCVLSANYRVPMPDDPVALALPFAIMGALVVVTFCAVIWNLRSNRRETLDE